MTKWDKFGVERSDVTEVGIPVAVFRLHGVLTNTPESYAFLEDVQGETRKKGLRCVINLEEVDHLTSAGLGIIAACYTSVSNSGGQMCLTGITGRVRVILNVMRMLDVIQNAASEGEAVKIAAA